jgi:hypothetical protein
MASEPSSVTKKSIIRNMTITEFWTKHPKVYITKIVLQIIFEIVFFVFSILCTCLDYLKNCAYVNSKWLLITSLIMMSLVHLYNIVRLLHKIIYFVKASTKGQKASIWKYILLDCYCCIGSFCYLFVQVCYYLLQNNCKNELKNIIQWLYVELVY